MKDKYAPYRINSPLDYTQIPEPIFDENPEYIELYWKAWEYAWSHVLKRPESPEPFYIDEAMTPKIIWIWDTCFMSLFCKYAPQIFPGIESLNNFYYIIHEKKKTPTKIEHPDNPPLFAWVEWEYFKLTGDVERLRWVLEEQNYLEKCFEFIENARRWKLYRYARIWIAASRKDYGYTWSGVSSGMDNTPRGRGSYRKILWLDLLSQQALSAEKIMDIAKILKNKDLIAKYEPKYNHFKELLNKYYWNDEDGIYYDIRRKNPNEQVKVKTPATFWPMLAGLCSNDQAKALVEKVTDPNCFGGFIPWVSVSRDDPQFDPRGKYWRGGVWLPLAYMGIKALERYGYYEIANSSADKVLSVMLKTYKEFEPHTIWEAYSPVSAMPSSDKRNKRLVRPEFCGWSALGPISLFIENILGFYDVNALQKKLKWNLYRKHRHGIKRLKFGTITTDIIYEDGKIHVNSDGNFVLIVNNIKYVIEIGSQTLT